MRTLNLGILAHVDAGKTSLTERLLYLAGVIDNLGSVDAGTTQTDSMDLERQRGITIKSAVVSFVLDDVTTNLIDTPGHSDFIAEVERVLRVLDGAVLVVSAVEGVQPQTRVLMRALQRLRLPTLIFVNKIDRVGAQAGPLLEDMARKLTRALLAMGSTHDLGTRNATFVPSKTTDRDFEDRALDLLVDHTPQLVTDRLEQPDRVSLQDVYNQLVDLSRRAKICPVFFGSAITGAGVEALLAAIPELLPASVGDAAAPVDGRVFKVDRGLAGERIAYARMFSGRLKTRDRVGCGGGAERTVTGIQVFERGGVVTQRDVAAGHIAKIWGLGDVRIGDRLGPLSRTREEAEIFAPPMLETIVIPRHSSDRPRLHAALIQLAEQDPLIKLRTDEFGEQLAVSLYGDVQKEVIESTLALDYDLEVVFRQTSPICIERPHGTGHALEVRGQGGNPFRATIGVRIVPAPPDSGLHICSEVEVGSIPVAIQKGTEEAIRATLRQGRHGWEVTDCTVTITALDHRPPPTPVGEFRKLAPLVVAAALEDAGTDVCEPIHAYRLEMPSDALNAVLNALARFRSPPESQTPGLTTWVVEGRIPSAQVHDLYAKLPGLTHGEGILDVEFDSYRPVEALVPERPRSDFNPFKRDEYLLHVSRAI